MALHKLIILRSVGKERTERGVGGEICLLTDYFVSLLKVYLLLGVVSRSESHENERILGACALASYSLIKCSTKLGKEGQRTTEIHDIALDGVTLRKTCDGLVNDRIEDTCRDVLFSRTLIQEGLDIGLCKNSATRRDGIYLLIALCKLVHLACFDLHKACHLVGKRTRTAGTGTVHSDFKIALEEKYLCILAAKLDNYVGIGKTIADSNLGSINLLHEGYSCTLGKSHTRRARNRTDHGLGYIKFFD